MEKRRQFRLRTWHVLVVLLVAMAGTWGGLRLYWKAQLRWEIAAIRAAGWPVTMEDVNRSYRIPEGTENAADLYLDALQKMVGGSADLPLVGKGSLPGPHEHLDPNTSAAVAEYLAENKESLDLLYKAASMERCRYPFDLGADSKPLWACLQNGRQAVFTLKLDAHWHADRGEAEPAAQAIESLIALVDSVEDVPTDYTWLVGSAYQSYALGALEDFLSRVVPVDSQLERVYRRLTKAQVDASRHLAGAMAAQRVKLVAVLAGPYASRYEVRYPGWHPDLVAPYVFFGLADRDAAKSLELYKRMMEIVDHPEERSAVPQTVAVEVSRFWGLTSQVCQFSRRAMRTHTRSLAHLQVARVAVAVERFRLANGHLPEDVAAFVPAYLDTMPKDPFDGQRLRYLRRDRGYVAYSVGDDLTDNHGTPVPKAGEPGDITFIVER